VLFVAGLLMFCTFTTDFTAAFSAASDANPFMDVPMNHWSYDAINQLSASGIVIGYPDTLFRGNQPATRYEIAIVVARTLAQVDLDKVSKTDFDLLTKLVVEFKDELDALGVNVEGIDNRLSVIEERIGGLEISGRMNFRYDYSSESNSVYNTSNRSNMYFGDGYDGGASIYFKKYIDDKVTFNSELATRDDSNISELYWKQFYVEVMFPWDVTSKIGRFTYSWNDYYDYKPWFGYNEMNGVLLNKTGQNYSVSAYYSYETFNDENDLIKNVSSDLINYGMNFDFTPNEWLLVGAQYNVWKFMSVDNTGADDSIKVLGAHFIVTPWNNIQIGGEYWSQNNGKFFQVDNIDTPDAWKAFFMVPQDVLKYTSLYFEYSSYNRGFWLQNDPFASFGAPIMFAMDNKNNALAYDTDSMYVRLDQKWNDKFSTYGRYVKITNDREMHKFFDQSVSNYSVGVRYNYTPSIAFSLEYDSVDYEHINLNDDNLIRVQTSIKF